RYARILKWLCISLLAYVVVAFTVNVDWMSVAFATFVPQIKFEREYFLLLVALLGTTISPYLYVWQASQEVEEDNGDQDSNGTILFHRRVDVTIGMGLSNIVAWFIILTAATVLFANGLYDVSTPAEAAAVLVPIAGKYASWLFTLGVIGTGLLAVPVLSGSAAYALSEVIGLRRFGLSSTWKEAKWFYLIVIALTVAGALTTLLGLNPIHALIYAAVGNALIAPLLILALIRLTEDKKVMGEMVNGPMSRVLLWGAFLLMAGSLVIWGILS
ncbi:divalent metal cation transporter, partial [Candidatus Uhrbacteria bacterium]|nr:divalent metal cation transporter [Candidatus Uhrbacteria bacterium]